jgi:hypothetical protein
VKGAAAICKHRASPPTYQPISNSLQPTTQSPSSVSKSHVKKYFNDCQMPQNPFVDATFLGF